MLANATNSTQTPLLSTVITVYDDWGPLEQCLRSLGAQTGGPEFEVIVVDDGSQEPAPESIRQWRKSYPLSIVREPHAGIPAARNRGVQESKGQILVFTDADCRFEANCLSELSAAIATSPQHNCFQLHLTGDCSNLLGRAEQLRLIAIQDQTLQQDGRIRYLNTSGFAIRRSHISIQKGPFDPSALRGEDTLLLASLMQSGELPLFVGNATVQHSVSLSLTECLRKDVRTGWLEGRTFEAIAEKGVRIRMENMQRVRMLRSTWKTSRQHTIGRSAWVVLVIRQLVERTVSVLYQCLPARRNAQAQADAS